METRKDEEKADKPENEDANEEKVVQPQPVSEYETRFHHTTTASSDGGKSLVLCPGQEIKFDSCESDNILIPHHGRDNGRIIYWNMHKAPSGDIVCTKDGKTYKYRADQTMVYGDC